MGNLKKLSIAMLSIHSSPIGDLGTQNTGGMSIYVRELAKSLGRRGHRIDIFTWDNNDRHEAIVPLNKNVRLIHLKINFNGNGNGSKIALYGRLTEMSHALEAFRSKQRISYDIIHSHYWLSGVLGAWAQRHWRRPHVLTYHTIGAVKNRTCNNENEPDLRLINEKKLAQSCDRIIVPTLKESTHLAHYCKAPSWKINVVPCGVDLNLFTTGDKRVSRRRLGLDAKETILLYAGRFTPLKGLDRLLSAMTHLTQHRQHRLVMLGGDGHRSPMHTHLKQTAARIKIQKAVTFAGRVDQKTLQDYYVAADVLVVPSYYESFGLVALESLACGTPVVATRVGAMETILQQGVTGMVVSDPHPSAMARSIDALLDRQRLGNISPERIRASVAGFSWSNMAEATLDAYHLGLGKPMVCNGNSYFSKGLETYGKRSRCPGHFCSSG